MSSDKKLCVGNPFRKENAYLKHTKSSRSTKYRVALRMKLILPNF